MAIKTNALSRIPTPKSQIPATDPKQIQNLWFQVRKQKSEDMGRSKLPVMNTPKVRGKQANDTNPDSSSVTPSGVDSTVLTSKSGSITIKHPKFRELCLDPRRILIEGNSLPWGDPCSYFHTQKPSSYTEIEGLKRSTLWLDTQPEFLDKVKNEYTFMDLHQFSEAEYAFFAKEHLLKSEPREEILDNLEDSSRRFPRAERMLELICKPANAREALWREPPLLISQDYPTYAFDIRSDCSYWISLHAFNSTYTKKCVYTPQDRMTCSYFTIEFKRYDTDTRKPTDQAATFGALALYNRYVLRNRVISKWTHEQECQLRHYALTIAKSSYTFWCIRPILEDGRWNGCRMNMIFVGSFTNRQCIIYFVGWINEIHRWGLTTHLKSCGKDIRLLAKKQLFRTSLGGLEIECTCDGSPDAAGTSEQETRDPTQALAGTSKIQGPALDNGAALAAPVKTAAEVCILGSSRLKSNVDIDG